MEIRGKRKLFLVKLLESTGGDEYEICDMWKIGKELGFSNIEIRKIGQYYKGEGHIIFRTDQGEISITHKGVKEAEKVKPELDVIESKKEVKEKSKAKPKKVFVVHGRNEKARMALFQFLRSVGIEPIEWGKAKQMTGEASPYPQQVIDVAFNKAQAIIVLITGDDEAKLRVDYIKEDDEEYERRLTPQARLNVIFEAGLAFGKNPKRTIFVSLEKEKTRPFSDVRGRIFVRLSNKPKSRNDLITHLKTAGCEVDITGDSDWLETGDFEEAVVEYKISNKKPGEIKEKDEPRKDEKLKLNDRQIFILEKIESIEGTLIEKEMLFRDCQNRYSEYNRIKFNSDLDLLKKSNLIQTDKRYPPNVIVTLTKQGDNYFIEREGK